MKDTIWALPPWLQNFPPQEGGASDQITDMRMGIVYIIFWVISAKILHTPRINDLMLVSFSSGLLFLIFFHLYQYKGIPIPASQNFVLNKTTHSLNLFQKGDEEDKILFKSPFNKLLKKNKNLGVVVDAEKYRELKKRGEIVDEDISKWGKTHKEEVQKNIYSESRYNQLSKVSYYLIVNIFSLAMLVGKADIKVFRSIFPWIVLGTFFTLIQSNLWVWGKDKNMVSYIFLVKRHLFTLGLSFCLMAVLVVLKFNNV